MPGIICAGLIAADLVFEVDAIPVKGNKARAGASHLITGGGAMNAASAIAALGGSASLAGGIGDDMFGAFLRTRLAERGIDATNVITMPGTTTSRSANVITPDGDRTIINHRDAGLVPDADVLPSDFPFDAALVDTRWPAGALRIVAAATKAGKPAVVDAEAPVAGTEEVLRIASHVVFSEQGLADFCGDHDDAALDRAAARVGGWCAVTRGARPVLCHDGARRFEVPVFATKALNTLGAGDVWHAAFALALAQGRAEADAARWANAAAALKVGRSIADTRLPTAAEVTALAR